MLLCGLVSLVAAGQKMAANVLQLHAVAEAGNSISMI